MSPDVQPLRPLWTDPAEPGVVHVLDQRKLPHAVETLALHTAEDAAAAIRDMAVRGAPLIGVTAAYGLALAARAAPEARMSEELARAAGLLLATRPTAKDLETALGRQLRAAAAAAAPEAKRAALDAGAARLAEECVDACRRIGEHGLPLLEAVARRTGGAPVNILTHCNAGWLACLEYGTATAPVYLAHERGLSVHVWVDETRPRNQGASLTAWELARRGVPHTLVADNAGGHLMQHGRVDLVLVGADRVTRRGDAANKIGTYLKALAARDNGVPFHVAVPASSFDPALGDGRREIPIEERDGDEVRFVAGWGGDAVRRVRICPEGTPAANPAFDVTPARLITGFITERGRAAAEEGALRRLFPEWP